MLNHKKKEEKEVLQLQVSISVVCVQYWAQLTSLSARYIIQQVDKVQTSVWIKKNKRGYICCPTDNKVVIFGCLPKFLVVCKLLQSGTITCNQWSGVSADCSQFMKVTFDFWSLVVLGEWTVNIWNACADCLTIIG